MKNISKTISRVSLLAALVLGVFFIGLAPVKADTGGLPTACGPNPSVSGYSYFDNTFTPFGYYQPTGLLSLTTKTTGSFGTSHGVEVYIYGYDAGSCTQHLLADAGFSHHYSAAYGVAPDALPHIYTFVFTDGLNFELIRDTTILTPASAGTLTTDLSTYGGGISVVFKTDDLGAVATTPAFLLAGVNQNINFTSGIVNSNQCNTGNAVSDSICKAAAFIFVPSDDAVAGFHASMTNAQTKIPFSYFYDLQTAFNGQTNSDTNSFPTLTFTFFGHPVTMLSYDTVEHFTGATNLALFKSLMIGAMYLALGYYYYERIKHLIKS